MPTLTRATRARTPPKPQHSPHTPHPPHEHDDPNKVIEKADKSDQPDKSDQTPTPSKNENETGMMGMTDTTGEGMMVAPVVPFLSLSPTPTKPKPTRRMTRSSQRALRSRSRGSVSSVNTPSLSRAVNSRVGRNVMSPNSRARSIVNALSSPVSTASSSFKSSKSSTATNPMTNSAREMLSPISESDKHSAESILRNLARVNKTNRTNRVTRTNRASSTTNKPNAANRTNATNGESRTTRSRKRARQQTRQKSSSSYVSSYDLFSDLTGERTPKKTKTAKKNKPNQDNQHSDSNEPDAPNDSNEQSLPSKQKAKKQAQSHRLEEHQSARHKKKNTQQSHRNDDQQQQQQPEKHEGASSKDHPENDDAPNDSNSNDASKCKDDNGLNQAKTDDEAIKKVKESSNVKYGNHQSSQNNDGSSNEENRDNECSNNDETIPLAQTEQTAQAEHTEQIAPVATTTSTIPNDLPLNSHNLQWLLNLEIWKSVHRPNSTNVTALAHLAQLADPSNSPTRSSHSLQLPKFWIYKQNKLRKKEVKSKKDSMKIALLEEAGFWDSKVTKQMEQAEQTAKASKATHKKCGKQENGEKVEGSSEENGATDAKELTAANGGNEAIVLTSTKSTESTENVGSVSSGVNKLKKSQSKIDPNQEAGAIAEAVEETEPQREAELDVEADFETEGGAESKKEDVDNEEEKESGYTNIFTGLADPEEDEDEEDEESDLGGREREAASHNQSSSGASFLSSLAGPPQSSMPSTPSSLSPLSPPSSPASSRRKSNRKSNPTQFYLNSDEVHQTIQQTVLASYRSYRSYKKKSLKSPKSPSKSPKGKTNSREKQGQGVNNSEENSSLVPSLASSLVSTSSLSTLQPSSKRDKLVYDVEYAAGVNDANTVVNAKKTKGAKSSSKRKSLLKLTDSLSGTVNGSSTSPSSTTMTTLAPSVSSDTTSNISNEPPKPKSVKKRRRGGSHQTSFLSVLEGANGTNGANGGSIERGGRMANTATSSGASSGQSLEKSGSTMSVVSLSYERLEEELNKASKRKKRRSLEEAKKARADEANKVDAAGSSDAADKAAGAIKTRQAGRARRQSRKQKANENASHKDEKSKDVSGEIVTQEVMADSPNASAASKNKSNVTASNTGENEGSTEKPKESKASHMKITKIQPSKTSVSTAAASSTPLTNLDSLSMMNEAWRSLMDEDDDYHKTIGLEPKRLDHAFESAGTPETNNSNDATDSAACVDDGTQSRANAHNDDDESAGKGNGRDNIIDEAPKTQNKRSSLEKVHKPLVRKRKTSPKVSTVAKEQVQEASTEKRLGSENAASKESVAVNSSLSGARIPEATKAKKSKLMTKGISTTEAMATNRSPGGKGSTNENATASTTTPSLLSEDDADGAMEQVPLLSAGNEAIQVHQGNQPREAMAEVRAQGNSREINVYDKGSTETHLEHSSSLEHNANENSLEEKESGSGKPSPSSGQEESRQMQNEITANRKGGEKSTRLPQSNNAVMNDHLRQTKQSNRPPASERNEPVPSRPSNESQPTTADFKQSKEAETPNTNAKTHAHNSAVNDAGAPVSTMADMANFSPFSFASPLKDFHATTDFFASTTAADEAALVPQALFNGTPSGSPPNGAMPSSMTKFQYQLIIAEKQYQEKLSEFGRLELEAKIVTDKMLKIEKRIREIDAQTMHDNVGRANYKHDSQSYRHQKSHPTSRYSASPDRGYCDDYHSSNKQHDSHSSRRERSRSASRYSESPDRGYDDEYHCSKKRRRKQCHSLEKYQSTPSGHSMRIRSDKFQSRESSTSSKSRKNMSAGGSEPSHHRSRKSEREEVEFASSSKSKKRRHISKNESNMCSSSKSLRGRSEEFQSEFSSSMERRKSLPAMSMDSRVRKSMKSSSDHSSSTRSQSRKRMRSSSRAQYDFESLHHTEEDIQKSSRRTSSAPEGKSRVSKKCTKRATLHNESSKLDHSSRINRPEKRLLDNGSHSHSEKQIVATKHHNVKPTQKDRTRGLAEERSRNDKTKDDNKSASLSTQDSSPAELKSKEISLLNSNFKDPLYWLAGGEDDSDDDSDDEFEGFLIPPP